MPKIRNLRPNEFRRGVRAFRTHEPREAMYRLASHLVLEFWGDPRNLADSVGVLLLTWNQATYRYGPPDFNRLEYWIHRNWEGIEQLRSRDISTLSGNDCMIAEPLFVGALEALEVAEGRRKGRRSPVGVAKALHILAPGFFPLWDRAIADAYGCSYAMHPAKKYVEFMKLSKETVEELKDTIVPLLDEKSPLKVLDEYNYAKFTKRWI